MLAVILAVAVAGPAMADGPGHNGQGADPMGEHPPNDVYVPSKAFENRGPVPPGNADRNDARFYGAGVGG